MTAGSRWQDHDLVFPSAVGSFADGPTITRALQALLVEAGLPKQRFHDLRHATASLHLAEGADIFEVKELLGHSQISQTANTYGHMTTKLAEGMVTRMDRALRADAKTSPPDAKTDHILSDTHEDELA